MSQKLKVVGVIGDWPRDEVDLLVAIAEQEALVSLMSEVYDYFTEDELEQFLYSVDTRSDFLNDRSDLTETSSGMLS